MEQLTKEEQQEVDYRQMVFPMRQFHKETGAVRVFFSLDEWLMHQKNYTEVNREVVSRDSRETPAELVKRGPGRPPKAA